MNLTDEDVMEQLRKGIRTPYSILFDRFYRLVLSVALRILRDRGEAEDVMQDVFFEIFNKASQFDPAKGSPKTWILQYAYHRSLSRRQYLSLRNFYDRHQTTEREVVRIQFRGCLVARLDVSGMEASPSGRTGNSDRETAKHT